MVWLMAKVGRNAFLSCNIFATVAKILRRQNKICQRKYSYKMLNEFKIAIFGGDFSHINKRCLFFPLEFLAKQEHLWL
jgi:hypothetical protein